MTVGESPAVEAGILPPGLARECLNALEKDAGEVRRAGRHGSTAEETPAATVNCPRESAWWAASRGAKKCYPDRD